MKYFHELRKCGNSKARYARQLMFSCSNLDAARIPRSQITCYSCFSMATHRTVRVPPKIFQPWQSFSAMASAIGVQAKGAAKLSKELKKALNEHRLNDAWNLHDQRMKMRGIPSKHLVNKLLGTSAQSLELQWLDRALDFVEKMITKCERKWIERDTLIYLSLCLARYGLPVKAAFVLRRLVETKQFPPVATWAAVLAYMSQTSDGAYLAAELVLEIGFMFQEGKVDPPKKKYENFISMKPNTTAVNIALAGCLLSGTNRKAELVLDMIPRIGVKTDLTLLIMMGHLYERNGRKEELKMLKEYIEKTYDLTDSQFKEFYNCLVSCHVKFGDLESASLMVLEMIRNTKKAQKSLGMSTFMFDDVKIDKIESQESLIEEKSNDSSIRTHTLTFEEFCQDQNFVRLEAESKEVLKTLIMKFHSRLGYITTDRGILQTETIFVKLVKAFLESKKIKELADFLVKVEKENSPVSPDNSPFVQVINTCISLKWLDRAHDLLNEARRSGVKTGSSVYSSLLKAYSKGNRSTEVKSLLKDACKAGVQLDSSSYEAMTESNVIGNDSQGALKLLKEMKVAKLDKSGQQEFDNLVDGCVGNGKAKLMAKLSQEIKDGQTVDCGVHDWNNVIHFFCRKRLMKDAEKALRKMTRLGHAPNSQSFHSLVTGYAAIGGRDERVVKLWSVMKLIGFSHGIKFDQELLDSVLYSLVRAGFFVRANEVVAMMEKGKMFIDMYKYRTLFLKYHITFCKGETPEFESEKQLKRWEAGLTFKKWLSLF